MALIDYLCRKFTVERPVKKITEATNKMIEGDFSVRVTPIAKIVTDESFYEVIECINRMAEELSGVEILRTDFIANVSHEMKTPLTVMQNYGTLLQAPDLSDEKRMEYAIVKVRDTGCGMIAEVGAHIFEKFYQGDASHSIQGNGLGLALVKRAIDITHGEISAESVVGIGTTFTVKIRRV